MMSSPASAFLFVLLAYCGVSAKRYHNRQLENDTSGLIGKHILHTVDVPDGETAGKNEGNRGRRTNGRLSSTGNRRRAGEAKESKAKSAKSTKSSSGTGEPDDESQFYEARSLDYFKDGIDPKIFDWVNKEVIAPGEYSCGFLKPELGSLLEVEYPTIEVYVCMYFAKEQPASKGNL